MKNIMLAVLVACTMLAQTAEKVVVVRYLHPLTSKMHMLELRGEYTRPFSISIKGKCESIEFPVKVVEGGLVVADCIPKGSRWEWGKVNRHWIFNGHLTTKSNGEFTIRWDKPVDKYQKDGGDK